MKRDDLEMNSRGMSVLLFAGLLAGGTVTLADDGQFEDWKVVGAGFGSDVAVAPSRPSRIFATGPNGLYRSDNDGADWTLVNGLAYHDFAINPSDPDLMIAEKPFS